ncbi:MAG: cytidine deaminase [Gammaproteobacteria bacterium]|nr:cytidine deaminase [Gammaproteobacteria bacterium]MDH4254189.1 cytidine deaminase [Gammaproteobacteria bacterium]MDH5309040.1 cytidine deaminase [Gammaproteobacteria bacterium]
MKTTQIDELFAAARKVQQSAHARYSNYFVGAALIDDEGRLHVGCNVENASYPEGSCAEANAIGAMVAAGGRRIVAIAIVGAPGVTGDRGVRFAGGAGRVSACTPCGGCRQRIREFADDATRILLVDDDGGVRKYRIEDLLPEGFYVE